jgi:hypothetical protein
MDSYKLEKSLAGSYTILLKEHLQVACFRDVGDGNLLLTSVSKTELTTVAQ